MGFGVFPGSNSCVASILFKKSFRKFSYAGRTPFLAIYYEPVFFRQVDSVMGRSISITDGLFTHPQSESDRYRNASIQPGTCAQTGLAAN